MGIVCANCRRNPYRVYGEFQSGESQELRHIFYLSKDTKQLQYLPTLAYHPMYDLLADARSVSCLCPPIA